MASHTLHDCFHAVIRAAKAADPTKTRLIHYAATYANTGLRFADAAERSEVTPDAHIQARYVLVNLSGWRGEEARSVKQALRKLTEIKK